MTLETNERRRRRKLGELRDQHAAAGGLSFIAEKADVSVEYLDQIMKGTLLPPKKDGSRSERALGEQMARDIERALGLEEGWLDQDWPFPMVDRARWDRLGVSEQGYVQKAMNDALAECEERRQPERNIGIDKTGGRYFNPPPAPGAGGPPEDGGGEPAGRSRAPSKKDHARP